MQEKFTEPPYILATAEHMSTGLRHDAATVWIEDTSTRNFRICLRELQDFDGLHENIRVVRIDLNIYLFTVGETKQKHGLFAIYVGKPVGGRFVQMVGKNPQ